MRPTIQIILAGILPVTANGRLILRKEPPFAAILTPGWAAIATLDLERDIPHIRAVFDLMAARPEHATPVIIGQGRRWITGEAHCIGRDPIHRGWRYTLATARYDWSRPCRLGDVRQRRAA